MKVRKATFERAIANEVALAEDAKNILNAISDCPMNAEQLISLSKQYSPDIAARVFYEWLLVSKHQNFIESINGQLTDKIEQATVKEHIKIIIVPGMFYKEHPETGADGKLIVEIARKFQFDVDVIDILSGGSVTQNSKIIENRLAEETHSNVWLISTSKGSSDIRHYLQNAEVPEQIKGWINIAGIPKGLHYVDYRLNNPFKRTFLRLLCLIFPITYQALVELKTTHKFWKNTSWPKKINMIHVVAVPHSAHLQDLSRDKYQKIISKGPSDGFVPLTDTLDLPGDVYPIWGCDHFLRTPNMSAYLYQLFNYLNADRKINFEIASKTDNNSEIKVG